MIARTVKPHIDCILILAVVSSMVGQHISLKTKDGALLVSVLSTGCSLFPTAYVTIVSNSLVLVGDLLRCVFEFIAVLFAWLIIRFANREDHEGLGKLEQLSSLVVASAMLAAAVAVGVAAWLRLEKPMPLENGGLGFVLALLAVFGNGAIMIYNRALSLRDPSPILTSQWKLFRAKAVASLVVVLSLGCSFWLPGASITLYSDSIGSIVLAAFLLYSSYSIISASRYDLLDSSIEEALRLRILRVIIEHEASYLGFHGIQTRRIGPRIQVDVILEFPGELQLNEVGRPISEIAERLCAAIPEHDVHVVPYIQGR